MTGIPPITPYSLPPRYALPENAVRWTVHPDRAVLLIHDMQRYFLNPFEEGMRGELVRTIADLKKRCGALGVPVAYTAQPGSMTDEQRGLLKDFWGPGMRTDETERAVVPELEPDADDWMSTKWRYSAFFKSELMRRMRALKRDQLIVCGVYAHIGVLSTALDAFSNDIQPFLVADALGDFSEVHHRLTLEYAARSCAMVVTSEDVLA
ncbi:isochorismatase family protein [Streptomyces sp. ASQP_92]|uniref:isochorismatase family protein n=1 Tax=unclassified Streptomyces TaxID=2593676 RepID=UPI0021C0D18A|nr:isochorismatase family protein [Streptomyces sp. ASQP_92]MCT9091784.1 isochorismatase family protein [Streptomyces sp. ASQP_92]